MKKIIFLALVVSGCTTISEVTPVGKDTFMVGASDISGMSSRTDIKAISLKRANEYCADQGKAMVPTSVDTSGVRGLTSTEAELTFLCVDQNDPANARPNLRKAPDTVVEVRK